MTRRLLLYPLWLRLWHWVNALLFLSLLVTGVSLHFGSQAIPFATARQVHNISGLMLAVGWAFHVVASIRSGNVRHYIPRWKGLAGDVIRQARFYGVGIFRDEPHPFPPTAERKFNPMQQVTYLAVVYVLMPVLIVNGIVFMVPDLAVDVFNYGAIWLVAGLHYLVALFLFLFMLGHVYLATAGETVTSEFHKMTRGWVDVEEKGDE
ncbi:MAG: cytochrome b/b6 domain-containing protein [Alphaproteobacteria bacterium]|nr:cytochrome b/b6 domain-containing protein [Alphaproteobacteria bacterium]MBF0130392.1 cytochrome b/b6 domain-containing protein [Alphaproteobacteria bacterium]